jgi:hypothetical protein
VTLVPLLIAAITLAGDRFGPRIAGVLTGLPVVAGPFALFVAVEQGHNFASIAAQSTLAAGFSIASFCLLYMWTCLTRPWWICAALGWLGFGVSTAVLHWLDLSFVPCILLAALSPAAVVLLAPASALPPTLPKSTRSQLLGRVVTGAAMIVFLTALAPVAGARLTGLMTVLPIATTVLAVFSHRDHGAPFAVHLLKGLAIGLYSLMAFFAVLALSLEPLGTVWAFTLALAAAMAAQIATLAARFGR